MVAGESEPATEPKPVTYAPMQSFSHGYETSQVSLFSVASFVPVMNVSLTVTRPLSLRLTLVWCAGNGLRRQLACCRNPQAWDGWCNYPRLVAYDVYKCYVMTSSCSFYLIQSLHTIFCASRCILCCLIMQWGNDNISDLYIHINI